MPETEPQHSDELSPRQIFGGYWVAKHVGSRFRLMVMALRLKVREHLGSFPKEWTLTLLYCTRLVTRSTLHLVLQAPPSHFWTSTAPPFSPITRCSPCEEVCTKTFQEIFWTNVFISFERIVTSRGSGVVKVCLPNPTSQRNWRFSTLTRFIRWSVEYYL